MKARLESPAQRSERMLATADASSPARVDGRDVLALQRTIGNRQTSALLVQRITLADMQQRSTRIRDMAKTTPDKGVNLWKATHLSGGSVHLLGTHHYHGIGDVGDRAARQYLVDFLTSGNFTEVYTEMKEEALSAKFDANLLDEVEAYAQKVKAAEQADKGSDKRAKQRANLDLSIAKSSPLGKFASLGTDTAYLSLAASKGNPTIGAFESNATKAAAHQQNVADLQLLTEAEVDDRLRDLKANTSQPDTGFMTGNQTQLFTEMADQLAAGKDIWNAEERNRQFMEIFKQDMAKAKQVRQLWIVGVNHLPGLILRFQDLGWTVTHETPPPP
jgi:hypothetical protein